jgi:hypothetical protein
MNVPRMPGFTAEASLYRTGSYRAMRVDGVGNAWDAVEAAQSRAARRPVLEPADVFFQTPWNDCFCWRSDGSCVCIPRQQVMTA